jgi:hypothetical protein
LYLDVNIIAVERNDVKLKEDLITVKMYKMGQFEIEMNMSSVKRKKEGHMTKPSTTRWSLCKSYLPDNMQELSSRQRKKTTYKICKVIEKHVCLKAESSK